MSEVSEWVSELARAGRFKDIPPRFARYITDADLEIGKKVALREGLPIPPTLDEINAALNRP